MEPIAPAPVATTTVQPASSGGMDYAGWVLLGGGLLLVAGGATFAMTRRPRRHADDDVDATSNGSTGVIPVSAPLATAPVTPSVEPTRPAAVIEPQSVRAPSMARQPNLDFASDDRIAVLEAMIAEGPSEANPFHSRRNRLRRADFLLRTGRAVADVSSKSVRPEQIAPARDRWSQMSFGGQRATRLSWKPVTNR